MVTSSKSLTFDDYLEYDNGTDSRYELVNGELLMVPLPTAEHGDSIDFLLDSFRAEINRLNYPWKATDKAGVYTGKNVKTGKDSSRTPDVCVMTQQQWTELKADKTAAAVLRTPPLLVVEMVSRRSKKTDYQDKKVEYEMKKIPEYWIVDLQSSKVLVLILQAEHYQVTELIKQQKIVSKLFPELTLTATQILSA